MYHGQKRSDRIYHEPLPLLQLKLFLKRKGIEFTEINTSEHPEVLKMLQDETSFLTLPQVFVDDNFLGGYDNIIELHQKGKFNRIFGLEE